MPRNNYGKCLEGGPKGFQYQVYDAKQVGPQELELTYLSKDGEEGFPGNITCKVIMKLTDDNAIDIKYEAETDKPTIVNMTNHSYFNLDGDAGSNADHLLTIDADAYTPVDSTFMTSGEIVTVEGTPMDFRTPTPVGKRINDFDFVQLKNGNGYDHNWVLKNEGRFDKVAEVTGDESGIVMEVWTDRPGVQVYTANFLENEAGRNGAVYQKRDAVCLETQNYPDAVHQKNFPEAICKKGETYDTKTAYRFHIE